MAATLFDLVARISVETSSATTALQQVDSQAQSASKSVGDVANSSDGASESTDSMSDSVMGAITQFISIAAAIKTATAALSAYAEMNENIAQLSMLFVGNAEAAEELAQSTRDLADAYGIDQAEALAGAYKVVSTQLGSTAEEMEEAIRISLELASVGRAVGDSMDVSGVVNLLSTEIRAFGFEASDAAEVADKLFKTIQLGNTDINQLSSALPAVSAVAADAGVEFEELLAIIAGASKIIPDNTQITSSLTTAIAQLQNSGAGVGKTFNEIYGAGFTTMLAEQGSLTNLLVDFDEQLKSTGSSLAEAFGVKGLKGIQAIVSVADDINASYAQIDDSVGLVSAGIEQMGEMGAFSMQQFKNELNNMLVGIGAAVMPILEGITEVMKVLTPILEAVGYLLQQVLQPVMEAIRKAIEPLMTMFENLKPTLERLGELLSKVSEFASSIIFAPLVNGVKAVVMVFEWLMKIIEPVIEILEKLWEATEPIREAFANLRALFSKIGEDLFGMNKNFSVLGTILKALEIPLWIIGKIFEAIGWVIQGIVWSLAKAIDLATKLATFGFGGTNYADQVSESFADDGSGDVSFDDSIISDDSDFASQLPELESSNTTNSSTSGSIQIINNNTFTQPDASLDDILAAQREQARKDAQSIQNIK